MAVTARRLELDEKLKELTPHVYYQPPASVELEYPAIIYAQSRWDKTPADNVPYLLDKGYEIMVIDIDPDSDIAEEISKWPYCRFNRNYTADNLNHFVFILYY